MSDTNPDVAARVAELIRKAESDGWRMMHASDSGMFFVRGDRRPILKDMYGLAFVTFCWAISLQGFIHTQSAYGLRFILMLFILAVLVFALVGVVRRYSKPASVECRFLSAAELADPNCPPVL